MSGPDQFPRVESKWTPIYVCVCMYNIYIYIYIYISREKERVFVHRVSQVSYYDRHHGIIVHYYAPPDDDTSSKDTVQARENEWRRWLPLKLFSYRFSYPAVRLRSLARVERQSCLCLSPESEMQKVCAFARNIKIVYTSRFVRVILARGPC